MKEFFIKFFTILVGLASLFFVFDNYLSDKINEKLTNRDYIETLSKSLRPFLVIDFNERIIYDHGAHSYIDSIKIKVHNTNRVKKITIFPNQYLQSPPLLEPVGSPTIYIIEEPVRGKNFQWIYNIMPHPMIVIYGKNPHMFKIEILK